MRFDTVIRNGTVVTASDTFVSDVGIRDGRIVALAADLTEADEVIDATGLFVLPGGIDSHCHVEQISSNGVMTADDFDFAALPTSLRMTYRVVDEKGRTLGLGLDLAALQQKLIPVANGEAPKKVVPDIAKKTSELASAVREKIASPADYVAEHLSKEEKLSLAAVGLADCVQLALSVGENGAIVGCAALPGRVTPSSTLVVGDGGLSVVSRRRSVMLPVSKPMPSARGGNTCRR